MRYLTGLALVSICLLGCGGESDSGGSGGGTTGGSGGATGGSSGTGGATGGSGGATGGSAGASGGSAGATGGSAGTGGATGGTGGATGGTGGGGPASPECTTATDCKVFADCCSCLGVPTTENPTSCPQNCLLDKCGEIDAPKAAACVAGRCVMGFECDSSKVTCKSLPPTCPAGQVARVDPTTQCWKGCVPAGECNSVKSCSDCTGELVCAGYVTQLGPQNHCVDVPKTCNGNFSCACLGPSVCTSPFSTCADFSGQKGVSCSCPNC